MHLPKNSILFLLLAFANCLLSQSLSISAPTSICSGDGFTASAGYSGTASVSYQYTLGTGFTMLSQIGGQAQISSYGCGTGTFYCQAIDASSTILAASTATVMRNCGSLSISSSQQVLCGPGTVTLTASGTTSFTWNSGATTAAQTLALNTSTLVSVNSTSSACPATASITVNNLLTLQSHSSICAGSTSTLTAAGAPAYNWFQPPGTLVNNGTSAQVVVNPTVLPQTYTVYGFFPAGCILSKTLSLIPYTYVPRSSLPASVCPSTSLTATALGAQSYTWVTGTQTVINSNFSNTLTAPLVYTLTADSSGCSATKQFAIGIYSVPILQVIAQNTTVCNNQSTTIFASGAASYTWAFAQGLMTNPYSNSISVQPFTSTVYSVTGTSAQGCSAQASITILFGNYPAISIFSTAAAVCPGKPSSITATGANQFIWTGSSFTGQLISPTVALPAGSYTVVGSNGGSCLDSTSFVIGALPPLQIIANASSDFSCLDETGKPWPVTLSANGVMSFSWTPYLPSQMTQSIGAVTVVSPTTTVCFTLTGYTNNCMGKKLMCIDFRGVCTGVAEKVDNSSVLAFPSFVESELYIKGFTERITSVLIIDYLGKVYPLDNALEQARNGKIQVSNLPSGNYMVIFNCNQALIRQKISKY